MSQALEAVVWLLEEAGLGGVTAETPLPVVEDVLRALVARLNGADPLRRATIRQVVIDRLKDAKIDAAARLVDAALGTGEQANDTAALQGQAVAFTDPEPWPEPVHGPELLERIQAFAGRFLELPPGAAVLVPAFVLATYAVELFPAAPYLVLHSPAPQCGKTRALEVLALLIRRPWLTIAPSTAVLFRVLEQLTPTLLLDEAEIVRGRGDAAGDVRALLQSGYRRGAVVPRCVGEANEVRNFRVFGPKVFALIGELPAALFDRCIAIEMQRRPRGRPIERFHPTRLEPEALTLRRQARRWVADRAGELRAADPAQLLALDERQQEVWDPLFAVSLVAGGPWYDRLVQAAHTLSGGREATSLGLQLLADLRTVFGGAEQVSSADLVHALNQLEGRLWADWNHGKGLTANALARLLKPFGLAPTKSGEFRGYKADSFKGPWGQYLSPQPPNRPESSNDATKWPSGNRPAEESAGGCETPENPHGDSLSDGWAVENTGGPGLWDYDGQERLPSQGDAAE